MADEPLHVLFISSWFPTRFNPFRGNFVERHAWAAATKHRVTVLHVEAVPRGLEVPKPEAFEKNGVSYYLYYHRLTGLNPLAKWRTHRKRWNLYRSGLEKVLQQEGPVDLIHANIAYPGGWMAARLSKRFGIPYVLTEHWTKVLPQNRDQLTAQERHGSVRAYRNARLVLPVSEDLGNAIRALGVTTPVQTIPNVVDTKLFYPGDQPVKRQFFHLSTLRDDHKNVSGLLRAVKQLSEQRDDFTVLIAGDGDAEPCRAQIQSLGLGAIVTQLGALQPAEVAKHMRVSVAFVLFSRYENLPCVISEAHACGTPVIATSVGGVPEMIDTSNGILVRSEDESALAEALKEMLDNQARYDRQVIATSASERYGMQSVANKLTELYHEALGHPK